MDENRRRLELKAFLRARRAAIAPEAAGVPRGKRRLAPGLRREELAAIAGVGVTWYTWLEQGREINVSPETLGRIARALRLSPSDEVYFFTLAGVAPPAGATRRVSPDARDIEGLQRLVDGFVAGPAVVFDARFDVVVFNGIWDALYALQDAVGPYACNHIWRMFVDPARRRLYVDREAVERNVVGLLRAHYARNVGDPRFEGLIDALMRESPAFAAVWNERQTQALGTFELRLRHPEHGAIALDTLRFRVESVPGALVFFGMPSDAQSAEAIDRARWSGPSQPSTSARCRLSARGAA
jgi:transcriptional regulator with XRE-family HTH domain